MASSEKLERLRQKYLTEQGNEIFDPTFARVARNVISEDGVRTKPYAGIPTLLDAPYRAPKASAPNLLDLNVALIGVPMERISLYHHVHDVAPIFQYRVADVGDVPFRSRDSLDKSIEDIETFYHQVVDAGVKPISAGGDHSETNPIMKALGRERPVGMIHIDAHCDTARGGGRWPGLPFPRRGRH